MQDHNMFNQGESGFRDIIYLLRRASGPEERVARNTIILALPITLFGIAVIIYDLFVGEKHSLLINLLFLSVICLVPIVTAFVSGLIIGGFYGLFLKHIEATNTGPSVVTFLVEWGLALCAPLAWYIFYLVQ